MVGRLRVCNLTVKKKGGTKITVTINYLITNENATI